MTGHKHSHALLILGLALPGSTGHASLGAEERKAWTGRVTGNVFLGGLSAARTLVYGLLFSSS